MPFPQRFNEIIQKITPPSEFRLMTNSHLFALTVLMAIANITAFQRGSFDLRIANQTIAWTSTVLIGLSFALSSICYFWNFADTKIIYRKHLGIVGFEYGLVHFLFTLLLTSQRFNVFSYFLSREHIVPFIFGASALAYFVFMVSISNNFAIHELGSKHWRILLRMGYVAFILVILHYAVLSWPWWMKWIQSGRYFNPSISIVIFILSLTVLILRLALEVDVRRKRKHAPAVQSSAITLEEPISSSRNS